MSAFSRTNQSTCYVECYARAGVMWSASGRRDMNAGTPFFRGALAGAVPAFSRTSGLAGRADEAWSHARRTVKTLCEVTS